jgi:hypothetical protein
MLPDGMGPTISREEISISELVSRDSEEELYVLQNLSP